MSYGSRIAIIMPARNEAEALPYVLADIPAQHRPRVVVVDNGSSDGTGEAALRFGAEVVREERPGYGTACQAGLRHVAENPPEIAVILDADHSDHPQDLDLLVAPILAGVADFVLGSRVELAAKGALPSHVRWGNSLATTMIRCLFGRAYRDMGPFRAIRWDSLQSLAMSDPAFGWNAEMQVKAIQQHLRILEVPVRYRSRKGDSKISGTLRGTFGAGSGIVLTILWLRFAPRWYARRIPLTP